jgi:hypothetical protein
MFAKRPTSELLGQIIEFLSDGQWHRSSMLLREMGLPFTDNNRRKLREIAENSDGQIAGGQDGYKLIEMMTHEEFVHWVNWMRSQTRKMIRRTLQATKRYYRKHPKSL